MQQVYSADEAAIGLNVKSFLPTPDKRSKAPWIDALNTVIAQAMTNNCNDEMGRFGAQGGLSERLMSNGHAVTLPAHNMPSSEYHAPART